MSARTFHWYWVSAVGASVAVVLALVLVVFPSSDWGPLGHDGVITAPADAAWPKQNVETCGLMYLRVS